MKKIISLILLVFTVFIAGCSQVDLAKVNLSQVSEEDINKVIVCNPPYMRYATECCLDKDNNSICDRDETIELKQENKEIDFAIINKRNSSTAKLSDTEKDLIEKIGKPIISQEVSKNLINIKIKDLHLNYIGNNENTVVEELVYLFEKKEYDKLKELNYELFKNHSSVNTNDFKKYNLSYAIYIIHNDVYYPLYEDSYINIENAQIKGIINNTINTNNNNKYIFQYTYWFGDSSNIKVKEPTQEKITIDVEDEVVINSDNMNNEKNFNQYTKITLPINNDYMSFREGKTSYKEIENGIQVSKEIIITNVHNIGIVPNAIEIKINGDSNNVILKNVKTYNFKFNHSIKNKVSNLIITPEIYYPLLPQFEYEFVLDYQVIEKENNSNIIITDEETSNIEVKEPTSERITTDIEVVQIYATNTADGNINSGDEIFTVIRLASGSASINVNELSLILDTQTLTYNPTSSTSTYNISYISNSGNAVRSGYISTGELVLISFVNQNNIGEGQTATLRLLSKNGAVKPVDMTTPSAMTKETTYLYP